MSVITQCHDSVSFLIVSTQSQYSISLLNVNAQCNYSVSVFSVITQCQYSVSLLVVKVVVNSEIRLIRPWENGRRQLLTDSVEIYLCRYAITYGRL